MVNFFVVILEHNLLEIQYGFFFLVIFSWRIIALPCYVGFCHKSTRISLRYTYVHSLLNLPPIPSNSSRLSQSTGLSSPHQTANSHWLSIFHMVIYMFQCYSQLTPPPQPISLYSVSERHRVVVQDNLAMIFCVINCLLFINSSC